MRDGNGLSKTHSTGDEMTMIGPELDQVCEEIYDWLEKKGIVADLDDMADLVLKLEDAMCPRGWHYRGKVYKRLTKAEREAMHKQEMEGEALHERFYKAVDQATGVAELH